MIDFYNVLLIIDLEQDIIEEIKDYGDWNIN